MSVVKYECPNGHGFEITDDPLDSATCPECGYVATHYNYRTGEVYNWTPGHEHRANCETMQDAMDDAFCNQYGFNDW